MKKPAEKTTEGLPYDKSVKNFLFVELNQAINKLKTAGIEKARFEAEIIFSEVLRQKHLELYLNPKRELTFFEKLRIKNFLKKRLKGTPLAYILKKQNFYGRDFLVTPQVLIPRPETEELCELVLKEAKGGNLIDLGCGSGCIGITLFLETKWENLVLCDISSKALAIARKNYNIHLKHSKKVTFLKHDFTQEFKKEYQEKFHVAVSNPPYVLAQEWETLSLEVKNFEPKRALLVKNPDSFFKAFFSQVYQILSHDGIFFLETSPKLIHQQKQYLQEVGFHHIKIVPDLAKKNRFLIAWKKNFL